MVHWPTGNSRSAERKNEHSQEVEGAGKVIASLVPKQQAHPSKNLPKPQMSLVSF